MYHWNDGCVGCVERKKNQPINIQSHSCPSTGILFIIYNLYLSRSSTSSFRFPLLAQSTRTHTHSGTGWSTFKCSKWIMAVIWYVCVFIFRRLCALVIAQGVRSVRSAHIAQYNKYTLLNRVVAGIYFMMTQPMSVCAQCSTAFTLFTHTNTRNDCFQTNRNTETVDNSMREREQLRSLLFNSMARLNANTNDSFSSSSSSFFHRYYCWLLFLVELMKDFCRFVLFPSFTRLPSFIFLLQHHSTSLHSFVIATFCSSSLSLCLSLLPSSS